MRGKKISNEGGGGEIKGAGYGERSKRKKTEREKLRCINNVNR